jgi:O-antigen ligase
MVTSPSSLPSPQLSAGLSYADAHAGTNVLREVDTLSQAPDRVRARVELAIPDLLRAGAFVLPLVVVTALHDAFDLPKLLYMLAISLALVGALALIGALALLTRTPGGFKLGGLPLATKALVVYVALVAVATIHSPDQFRSIVGHEAQFQGLLATVAYAIAYLAAGRSLGDVRRLRDIMAVAVAAAFIVGLYAILQLAGYDPIWRTLFNGLVFSTLGNHTALAANLVLALPLALALTGVGDRSRRIAAAIAVTVIGLALGLAFSRGGYIAAGASLVVLAALLVRRWTYPRRRFALVAAGTLVVVAITVVAIQAALLIGRTPARVGGNVEDPEVSVGIHLDLWAVGARMVVDNPVLGIGPEMYPIIFPAYRDRVLPPDQAAILAPHTAESPHDVPLAIAVGAGLPAVVAYLVVVVGAFRAGMRRLASTSATGRILIAGALAAVAGHFVTDLFMTADIAASWLFWLLLGALTAAQPANLVSGEVPVPTRPS